jgi:GMP reductase
MKKSLNYKDIHLIPNYSELRSRSEADVFVDFGKFTFKLPIVPANMASCIDLAKATWLAKNGYFYIMHRFYEYDVILNWMHRMNKCEDLLPFISISVGIKKRDVDLIATIAREKLRLDYVTVDVAHGDHSEVISMLRYLNLYKESFNPDLFIIGGNIATPSAYIRMAPYVQAVKVGIACGASCITYNKTGFASPMFSTVSAIDNCRMSPGSALNNSRSAFKLKDKSAPFIIADGGISCNGDIAKALVAGADMVMAGSMFARCIDSPAMVDPTDPTKKLYFGSASSMNGNKKNIEGRTLSMPMNGMTYEQKMNEIYQDLTSAVSYAGGDSLQAFQEVDYALI